MWAVAHEGRLSFCQYVLFCLPTEAAAKSCHVGKRETFEVSFVNNCDGLCLVGGCID